MLDYFPDALMAVAHCSKVGNDQHNPGEPLHWAKEKSTDEADALIRHFFDRGKTDTDGVRHSAKMAWRALALLQREIEAEEEPAVMGAGVAPASDEPRCHYCGARELAHTDIRDGVRGHQPSKIFGDLPWHPFKTRSQLRREELDLLR